MIKYGFMISLYIKRRIKGFCINYALDVKIYVNISGGHYVISTYKNKKIKFKE